MQFSIDVPETFQLDHPVAIQCDAEFQTQDILNSKKIKKLEKQNYTLGKYIGH